jgi:hypothetical protein
VKLVWWLLATSVSLTMWALLFWTLLELWPR